MLKKMLLLKTSNIGNSYPYCAQYFLLTVIFKPQNEIAYLHYVIRFMFLFKRSAKSSFTFESVYTNDKQIYIYDKKMFRVP